MRRTQSMLFLGLIILLAMSAMTASASAQSSSIGPFDPRAGKFGMFIKSDAARAPDTLAVASDRVWIALRLVYDELGIPLTIADTQSHVIGAIRLEHRKPIGGQRLSRVLECGESAYGPNAERYTVQLTVLTNVQALGEKLSTIDTRVGGSASPNGTNSVVTCASSGVLEERVKTMVWKALGR